MSSPSQPETPSEPRACTFAELDAPDSIWNQAAARTAQGDPFCCRTEWALSFHEAFLPKRRLHLWTSGESVVAFAEQRVPGVGTLLEPLESHWHFGCPLLGERAVELFERVLEILLPERAPRGIVVSGLLPGGALANELRARCAGRFDFFPLEPAILRSASLEGGLDGFLGRRSALLRKRLRQAARRAAERGVWFERFVPRSAGEAAALYERMLAVERASWKGLLDCGMSSEGSNAYYGAMLRRVAASGRGRVVLARRGDDDIGFVFGSLAGPVYRGQQFSFVDAWRPFSIGNLLQLEQLRWLCEEGVQRYDMGPVMEYKLHWTEIETRIDTWLLRPARAGLRRSA